MKVLLVSFIADAPWTGMGHWTYAVKAGLEERGHSVDTWFEDRFPRTRALGRLAILVFPAVLAFHLFQRRPSYDVVVLHEPVGFWYGIARRVARRLPPMVAMCHNVERRHYETMVRFTQAGLARVDPLTRLRAPLLRHWQSNGTIRLADHVICLSSVDRDYITRSLGVGTERVTMTVNGVSESAFVQRPASRPGQVIWVGGWLDVKGSGLLPALWRQVRERCPDATLTLIGTGIGPDSVLGAFHGSDRESITVVPRVENQADMRRLYASGSAYLLTSLSEGSPLSLLEALAAGLPAVATRVGGVPDIVTDGLNALLFDPKDPATGAQALTRLLTDPSLSSRLAEAARARARELTWRRTAEQIDDALQRATGRQLAVSRG